MRWTVAFLVIALCFGFVRADEIMHVQIDGEFYPIDAPEPDEPAYSMDAVPLGTFGGINWGSTGGSGGYAYVPPEPLYQPSQQSYDFGGSSSYSSSLTSSVSTSWDSGSNWSATQSSSQPNYSAITIGTNLSNYSIVPEYHYEPITNTAAEAIASAQAGAMMAANYYVGVVEGLQRTEAAIKAEREKAAADSSAQISQQTIELANARDAAQPPLVRIGEGHWVVAKDDTAVEPYALPAVTRFHASIQSEVASVESKLRKSPLRYRYQIAANNSAVDLLAPADGAAREGDGETAKTLLELANVLADIATSLPPGIGWARDVYEATTGTNLITGDSLSSWERGIAVLGVVTGGVTAPVVKSAKSATRIERILVRILRAHPFRKLEEAQEAGRALKLAKEIDAARNMAPEAKYIIGEYQYTTDRLSRVVSVSGELHLEKAAANSYQQRVVRDTMGLAGDDAGHLIGARFGGVAERINLVAMDSKLNRSNYVTLENQWARAIKEGKSVNVELRPVYFGSELRPARIEVDYHIDDFSVELTWLNNPPK